MAKKTKYKDLPKPLAFIMTVAIILVLPLPFAAYLGGIDWLTSGSQAGLKEFTVSYLLGLSLLCISLSTVVLKDRRGKNNRNDNDL